jgi:Rrf2 family protein
MAHLATLEDGASVPAADLAAASRIPRHYVSKLMRRLVIAELVVSRRGHGGGFTLVRAPSEIQFVDILEAVGFPADTDSCVFGWDKCNPDEPCPLHPSWSRLKASFLAWARETSLGDVRENWDEILKTRLAAADEA